MVNALNIEIRQLDDSYINNIVSLEPQNYPIGWSRGLIESEFRNPNSLALGIINRVNNELIGYSFGRFVFEEFNILNIAIIQMYRKMGLGKILLNHMLKCAQERLCLFAFLEVRESNLAALNLYEKSGFKVSGIRKEYYKDNGENAITMQLSFNL